LESHVGIPRYREHKQSDGIEIQFAEKLRLFVEVCRRAWGDKSRRGVARELEVVALGRRLFPLTLCRVYSNGQFAGQFHLMS
jgi:hypothetical protein